MQLLVNNQMLNYEPNLPEGLYLDSAIDTEFGFLTTIYSSKISHYWCNGEGNWGIGRFHPTRHSGFYPDQAGYRYYILRSGHTTPAIPPSNGIPGRLKAAFCLKESCYFKHTDLNGRIRIVSHLFEEVLASNSIVDVIDQATYKDGVLILAKTQLNSQNSPTLKIFYARKNSDGTPQLTEISWPSEFKSTLESSNTANLAVIGESAGILVDQSFLVLRSLNNQFNVRMNHTNISSAMNTADGRRNQTYVYDLGNIFDNEKSKRLFRISDDFLLREAGKFYVISPKDPFSELFAAEVPSHRATGQSSSIAADRVTNSVYLVLNRDTWYKTIFKLEK